MPLTIATNMGLIKGGVVLPDVEYAWDYFYGTGRTGRARRDAHEGPQSFRGSVPQVYVLFNESRAILEMILGSLSRSQAEEKVAGPTITYSETTVIDTAEDFSSPNRKDGNYAIFAGTSVGYIGAGGGITTLNVFPTPARTGNQGWNGPIPVSLAVGDGYEIRQTESVGTAAGSKFIVPTQRLHTMAWGAQFRGGHLMSSNSADQTAQPNMNVNYLGGKVNRATLSARQGEKLVLSLDEVLFRDLIHDIALPSASVAKHNALGLGAGDTKAPTPVHPTEDPLVFSQGVVSFFELGNVFARIQSFSLSIDHALTEGRYVARSTVGGSQVITQVPLELVEGQLVVTMEVEAILETRQYWEHLMRQGLQDDLLVKTGFDVRLRFQNVGATEFLDIQSPAAPNPSMTDETGNEVNGTTALAGTDNIGVLLEAAPHSIPAEGEALIVVRQRLSLPNLVMRFLDV